MNNETVRWSGERRGDGDIPVLRMDQSAASPSGLPVPRSGSSFPVLPWEWRGESREDPAPDKDRGPVSRQLGCTSCP